VRDVVQANIRAMESNAQGVFNVTYSKNINLKELAVIIMESTGIMVSLTYESPRIGDIKCSVPVFLS